MTNHTHALAASMAGLQLGDLPTAVRSRVHTILIDALACALLGREGPETPKMEGLATELSGTGDSVVIGSTETSSLAGACMINAYQVTAFNLCDVYRPAHSHMSPLVVAPAIAVAERCHSSGTQLLAALAAGFETACRVGAALDFTEFRARGWHSPGVIGPFGGAAAAARLYGLDETGMRNALGLAGSQSGGSMAQWGTPTIKFHQSRGALSGLAAAVLAAQGYGAGADVIAEPEGGVLEVFSGGGEPGRVVEGLGERWDLMDISLKRWPSGSGLQTTVSALFDLLAEHAVETDDIAHVRVTLPPHAYKAHGEMGWEDRFKAMLSARYITAAIVTDRRCWVEQFADERRLDGAIDRFARECVDVEQDHELSGSTAVTEISLRDGTVLRDARERPKGDPADPLEREQIVDKFRDANASVGGAYDDALEGLLALEAVDDVADVLGRLRAATVVGSLA